MVVPYFYQNNIQISHIAIGKIHCLATDDIGRTFSWGDALDGKLGTFKIIFKISYLGHPINTETQVFTKI